MGQQFNPDDMPFPHDAESLTNTMLALFEQLAEHADDHVTDEAMVMLANRFEMLAQASGSVL